MKDPLEIRNGIYYYRYKDPRTGAWKRKSTKTGDENLARAIMQSDLAKLAEGVKPLSLLQVLKLYEDTKTNPRYLQAKIDGTRYGYDHATHVAASAKYIEDLLLRQAPKILHKRIADVTILDINKIKELVVNDMGRCGAAMKHFQNFKTFFSQAHQDGLIDRSPCLLINNIGYKQEVRPAISINDIADIIALKDKFPNIENWAFFTILATTGMRRSEVLAMNINKVYKNVLTIDTSMKRTEIGIREGLPKCDIVRAIPLSQITLEAISAVSPAKDGRLFPYSTNWPKTPIAEAIAVATACYPDKALTWNQITCHVLRHSLNSALLVYGSNDVLTQKYFGWEKQHLNATQRLYTHVYVQDLIPIADKIDELLNPNSGDVYRHKILAFHA